MEIRRLFYAFLHKLWLIVLLTIIGGGVAGFVSIFLSTPVYEAETTIYAMNKDKTALTGEGLNYQDLVLSQQLVKDFSEIISSNKVTSMALRDLNNASLTEDDLSKMVSIDLKKDSSVMAIRADAPDPQMAAAVANAMSRAFTLKIRELTNSESISILDEAQVPDRPLTAGGTKKILVGIMAGMALAFGIIYLQELFDTTIKTAEDVERGLKLRVIGIIPEHNIR